MMMLVTWLIELYLNQLGELRDQGKEEKEYERVQVEFTEFINHSRIKVSKTLLPETVIYLWLSTTR